MAVGFPPRARRRAQIVLLGTAAALASVPAARAAVGATQVTAPAEGTEVTVTSPSQVLGVAGTAPGASAGDTVALRCLVAPGLGGLDAGTAAAGTGTFAASVPLGSDSAPRGRCRLTALPTPGAVPTAAFAGRLVTVEPRLTRLLGARVVDAREGFQYPGAYVELGSAGGGGLRTLRRYDGATGSASVVTAGGALGEDEGGRAFVQVDGRDAYVPAAAARLARGRTDLPGQPALAVTAARPAPAADATMVETSDLMGCAAGCSAFVATGVRLTRTTTVTGGGTRVEQVDRLAATDGRAHALSFHEQQQFRASTAVAPAIGFSWADAEPLPRASGLQVPGPPAATGPVSLVVQADKDRDADAAWPAVGVTFDPPPTRVDVRAPDDLLVLRDGGVVPAAGELVLRTTYQLRATAAQAAAAALDLEDAAQPPALALTSPAPGAAVLTRLLTVTGQATDNRRVAGVTVAGHPATVAPDGRFSATVPVPLGVTALPVSAVDGVGQATSTTLWVTGVDRVAPRVTNLRLDPARFRATRAFGRLARGRRPAPRGTTVRLTLGEAASLRLTLWRVGRSRAGSVQLRAEGVLLRHARAGRVAIRVSGRIGRRTLRPGTHRLQLVATDAAGNRTGRLVREFTVTSR